MQSESSNYRINKQFLEKYYLIKKFIWRYSKYGKRTIPYIKER